MPWKVSPVSQIRLTLVHHVRSLHHSVTDAARQFGVSRKTANKWLAVYDRDPHNPLLDRSRRPLSCSPRHTDPVLEQTILQLRDRFNWGPRKLHAYLLAQGDTPLPSIRTFAAVLQRNGRIAANNLPDEQTTPLPLQRFERPAPNDLWQVDHKGPVEIQRRRLLPLSIIDDHSRYCLAFRPLPDKTLARAWDVLWDVFGEVGLPASILTDNAFNVMTPLSSVGIGWFDARLLCLGIQPIHGQPYHPQTQGKVERFHRTADRELIDFNARHDNELNFNTDLQAWREVYNHLRPHEAIGDQPPGSRWRPSQRPRPAKLPSPQYPSGSLVHRVAANGTIPVNKCRVMVGKGIIAQHVLIKHQDPGFVRIFYCQQEIRSLWIDQLQREKIN
jgi:transposase InsO family protein